MTEHKPLDMTTEPARPTRKRRKRAAGETRPATDADFAALKVHDEDLVPYELGPECWPDAPKRKGTK